MAADNEGEIPEIANKNVIYAKRLRLRCFCEDDACQMLENWIGDESVQREYGEPAYKTIEAVERLLIRWISMYKTENSYRWAIDIIGGDENIGQISFCKYNEKEGHGEIEYCIGRKYQCNGYATEALNAVVDFTFSNTGIIRLEAFHRGKNIASGKVLDKSVMRYCKTTEYINNDEDTNSDVKVYYEMTKEEYLTKKTEINQKIY